jgi:glycine cleavage system H protein
MANVPDNLRYTAEHEYVKTTDTAGEVLVGITEYAQGELGDIVFLNLPKPGEAFKANDVFGTIEAVKAVSDLYSPLAGTVVAVNEALDADPALVNRDPFGEGWMIRLKLADAAAVDALLDAAGYRSLIGA